MGCIYMAVSDTTEKCYIGLTTKFFDKRKREHKRDSKKKKMRESQKRRRDSEKINWENKND